MEDVNMDESNGGDATVMATIKDRLSRATVLQEELQQFADRLSYIYADYFQQVPTQIYTSLSNDVRAEISSLRKISKEFESGGDLASHRARSSNLPFYEALWDTAKRSKEIVLLQYTVSSITYSTQILAPGNRIVRTFGQSRPSKDCHLIVDIVADGGQSWWKVSSITNKRLIFDMAREAIFCGESSDDEDEEDEPSNALSDDADISLIKLAKNLATAARGYRIRTKTPVPHLVLPRMVEGEHSKVDIVLNTCRKLGVNVICGNSLSPAPALSAKLLETMAPSPKANFSEMLNIDTSVLVGLVSDFSHSEVPKHPWFRRSHLDHAELESKQSALSIFYPVLGTHLMVCTKEAEQTFRHIVDTIGTEAEKARADCIISGDSQWSREQRLEKLQSLTIHNVPSDLQLPVQVVDFEENSEGSQLSRAAKEKMHFLHNPGRSVFLYGWMSQQTTLTCNSVAVKELEKQLETLPSLGAKDWPCIWAFPISRPLVGIPPPAGGHKRVKKHIGDCSIKCTCGEQEL